MRNRLSLLRLLTPLLLLTPLGVTAASAAPQIVNSANGHLYQLVPDVLSWTDARAAAEASSQLGVQGHLVTISSAAENDFIIQNFPSGGFWIGGVQDPNAPGFSEPSGGWTWVTGEPFTYTQWNIGEPNNVGGEDYSEMAPSGGWNDTRNTNPNFNTGYLVEYDTNVYFSIDNRHSYAIVPAILCWDDARDAAATAMVNGFQGHLATITSPAERDFVNSLPPLAGNLWLGGFQDTLAPDYSEPSGGWRWITGEPFAFTDWTPTEPNNGGGSGEEYLELNGGFLAGTGWNDNSICSGLIDGYLVEFSVDLGAAYCNPLPNSTGMQGRLTATGSNVAASNNVTLQGSNLPPSQFGIFVVSEVQASVQVGGGGILCLGGAIGRYNLPSQILQVPASGSVSLTIDTTAVPQASTVAAIQAGETWNFQFWHRDFGPGTQTSNFTDGRSILFE